MSLKPLVILMVDWWPHKVFVSIKTNFYGENLHFLNIIIRNVKITAFNSNKFNIFDLTTNWSIDLIKIITWKHVSLSWNMLKFLDIKILFGNFSHFIVVHSMILLIYRKNFDHISTILFFSFHKWKVEKLEWCLNFPRMFYGTTT